MSDGFSTYQSSIVQTQIPQGNKPKISRETLKKTLVALLGIIGIVVISGGAIYTVNLTSNTQNVTRPRVKANEAVKQQTSPTPIPTTTSQVATDPFAANGLAVLDKEESFLLGRFTGFNQQGVVGCVTRKSEALCNVVATLESVADQIYEARMVAKSGEKYNLGKLEILREGVYGLSNFLEVDENKELVRLEIVSGENQVLVDTGLAAPTSETTNYALMFTNSGKPVYIMYLNTDPVMISVIAQLEIPPQDEGYQLWLSTPPAIQTNLSQLQLKVGDLFTSIAPTEYSQEKFASIKRVNLTKQPITQEVPGEVVASKTW